MKHVLFAHDYRRPRSLSEPSRGKSNLLAFASHRSRMTQPQRTCAWRSRSSFRIHLLWLGSRQSFLLSSEISSPVPITYSSVCRGRHSMRLHTTCRVRTPRLPPEPLRSLQSCLILNLLQVPLSNLQHCPVLGQPLPTPEAPQLLHELSQWRPPKDHQPLPLQDLRPPLELNQSQGPRRKFKQPNALRLPLRLPLRLDLF